MSIALQILRDAYGNPADTFVIVSGDSDLVPVLDILRTDFPRKQTVVYVPVQTPDRSLRSGATLGSEESQEPSFRLAQACPLAQSGF